MEPGRGAHRAVKLLATRSWNDIDGLWMQVGCYTANAMQLEAGRKPGQLLPCAGEGSNGGRVQMLPAGTAADGATGSYAPMGAPRISYASPPYSGALALKLAVQALEGRTCPSASRCRCRWSPTTPSSSARRAAGRR